MSRGEKGVVKAFKIGYSDRVEVIANKLKKDGTESKIGMYCYVLENLTAL